jgi:hypothetical protein
VERYEDVEDEIANANATAKLAKDKRKKLRTVIKGAGFDLAAFDRYRVESQKSSERREAEDAEFRRYMAWSGMPLGTQAEMFKKDEPEDDVPPELQVKRVRRHGVVSGRAGRERSENPWQAGQLLHQIWHEGWLEGKEGAAQSTVPTVPLVPAGEPELRRRGRPPGAKNADKKAAAPSTPHAEAEALFTPPNPDARELGRQDGASGEDAHAGDFPQGSPSRADYVLGHADGERERQPESAGTAPKRGADLDFDTDTAGQA